MTTADLGPLGLHRSFAAWRWPTSASRSRRSAWRRRWPSCRRCRARTWICRFARPGMYYMSVTAHGTLMALVFTTFFIMGFGYVVAQHSLGAALAMRRTAWVSFWIAVLGTARGGRRHSGRQSHGALHVLSAAQGAPGFLHRPDARWSSARGDGRW